MEKKKSSNKGSTSSAAASTRMISKELIAKTRIESLQKLCRIKNLKAMLFIPGADGRFNPGSQAFMKWALLGETGKSLALSSSSSGEVYIKEEYEALEDCIVIILPDGISIFYSQAATKILHPVLAQLRGVREYVATGAEMEDLDRMEHCKIMSFLEMVGSALDDDDGAAGRGRVGIPFPLGFDDARDLESWPLIQAHALDEMGGKGFFTARYFIQDINAELRQMMASVDASFVDRALGIGVPTLRHHLDITLSLLDGNETSWAGRSQLSEEELSEPLRTLYDFGHVQDNQATYHAAKLRAPRALLGSRTILLTKSEAQPDKQVADHCLHVVIEGEEPSSGLRFCRTYFLRANALPDASIRKAVLLPGQDPPFDDDDIAAEEASRLHATYHALVQSIQALQQQSTTTLQQLPSALHQIISSHVGAGGALSGSMKEQLKTDIQGTDAMGVLQDIHYQYYDASFPILLYVRLIWTLPDMRGGPVAVAVGDTLLYQPSSAAATKTYQFLTDDGCAPYHRAWAGQGLEDFYLTRMTRCLMDPQRTLDVYLGHPVMTSSLPHTTAHVLLPSPIYPVIQGQLRLFDFGFALIKTGVCPLIVSFTHMVKDIRFSQPSEATGGEQPTYLQIQLTQPLAGSIPFDHAPSELLLVLPTGSQLPQAVLNQLPSWRLAVQQRHEEPDQSLEGVPLSPQLAASVEVYNARMVNTMNDARGTLVDTLMQTRLDLNLSDLMRIDGGNNATLVTTQGQVVVDDDDEAALVTVLLGLPGSGVMGQAGQVLRFVGGGLEDNERWVYAPVTVGGPSVEESLASVSAALSSTLQSFPQRSALTTKRVLLAVCGPISMPSLCLHLLQQFKGRIQVASACAVVNLDFLVTGGLNDSADTISSPLLPCIWDQVTEGWCSSVVLTNTEPASRLAQFTSRLHQSNRHAVILRASSLRAYLEPDVLQEIVIKERFQLIEQEALRQRNVCPSYRSLDALSLCPDKEKNRKTIVSINGASPLDPQRLIRCMQELFPNAIKPSSIPSSLTDSSNSDAQASSSKAAALRRATELAINKVQDAQTVAEDEKDLQASLNNWHAASTTYEGASSQMGQITCIHGMLSLPTATAKKNNNAKVYVLEASRRHISLTEAAQSSSSLSTAADCCNTWWISSLRPLSSSTVVALHKLLQQAIPYICNGKEARTHGSITSEELQAIEAKAQAQGRPLPDGYMYDGKYYVDFYGSRLPQRPDLEDLVHEYLKEANEETDCENVKRLES